MKITGFFTALCLFSAQITLAQIPNNGFENWSSPTSLDDWDSSNEGGGPEGGVSQSDDAYTGESSVRIIGEFDGSNPNPGYIHSLIETEGSPESMHFFLKGNLAADDTLYALITLMDASYNVIGAGVNMISDTGLSDWTEYQADVFSFGGSGSAAYCDIYFMLITYQAESASEVFLDEVTLEGITASVAENKNTGLTLFINGEELFYRSEGFNAGSDLRVYSMSGMLLLQEKIYSGNGSTDIAMLPAGTYLVSISDQQNTITRRIVRQ